MEIWTQLTVRQAQGLYGVPEAITAAEGNRLWGRLPQGRPFGMDEPRPFFALFKNSRREEAVTFHCQTIEPETWEHAGRLPDPFSVPGGYLLLDKAAWEEAIRILEAYPAPWPAPASQGPRMFRPLEAADWASLHLRPEWFNSPAGVYLQIFDPVADLREAPVTTLVSGSVVRSEFYLGLCQFPTAALREPGYMPRYYGLPRIDLDRGGLLELIALWREQLASLPDG